MRDGLEFNDEIAITLPAHIWYQFATCYMETDWSNGAAVVIAMAVQEKIVDPLAIKEHEARLQAMNSQNEQIAARFANWPGDIPPGYGPE
jgi:hypothetical protein